MKLVRFVFTAAVYLWIGIMFTYELLN